MISIYLLFDCDTSISMILKFQFNNFEKEYFGEIILLLSKN